MQGIPIAFLLTEDKNAKPPQLWLAHLRDLIGDLRYITNDDSKTEKVAIRRATRVSEETIEESKDIQNRVRNTLYST
ncbi:hypothetical protein BGX27_002360 [Mortierella sp. AM989]|nr:hypothetical protein BGX27_002360 [Mortierella sp. AM989]